jgi:hypothetical protein
MSETDLTLGEVVDSMTGHEEWAVSRQFGVIISELTLDPSMVRRAAIFVVKKREGMNEDEARNYALDLTILKTMTFFAEESEEAGKDESESEPQPEPQLDGAPEPVAHLTSI